MKSSSNASSTTPATGGLCSSTKNKYRAAETGDTTNGGQQHTINMTGKYNDDSLLIKDKEKIELKTIKNINSSNANVNTTFTNLNSDYQIKINLVDNNPAANVNGGNGPGGGLANGQRSGSARRCFCSCSRTQCTKESTKQTRKKIKRPLPCLFAWSLLIATSGAYFIFVSRTLLEEVLAKDLVSWTAIISLQIVILSYVIINFLIAIFRDPGRFQKIVIPPDDPTFNDDNKCPLYRSITIKKASVKTKWCSVSFKLTRSSIIGHAFLSLTTGQSFIFILYLLDLDV